MAQAKFPNTIDGWNSYYGVAIPYLNTHEARLNVLPADLTELNDLHDNAALGNGWLQVFPLTQGAQATSSLRNTRDELIEDMKDVLQRIYGDIPERDLTNDDRAELKIPKRDTKATARGPITTAPDVALTPLEGAKIRQRLRFDTDKNRASMHPLADGWERAVKIGGGPPANPSESPIRETGTGALNTIDAGMDNDRKSYYAFFRWINISNPENNSGWSPMKVVTISGGTVGTE